MAWTSFPWTSSRWPEAFLPPGIGRFLEALLFEALPALEGHVLPSRGSNRSSLSSLRRSDGSMADTVSIPLPFNVSFKTGVKKSAFPSSPGCLHKICISRPQLTGTGRVGNGGELRTPCARGSCVSLPLAASPSLPIA